MIDFTFRGEEYHLYFNGSALFNAYAKFGADKNILDMIEPMNKAGFEVAPDLFLEEFAKREAVDQASGEDDAASLRAAVESRDLHDGFLLYGYIYDADELRALAEDTLDVEKIEFVTDGERCPVYYIELK